MVEVQLKEEEGFITQAAPLHQWQSLQQRLRFSEQSPYNDPKRDKSRSFRKTSYLLKSKISIVDSRHPVRWGLASTLVSLSIPFGDSKQPGRLTSRFPLNYDYHSNARFLFQFADLGIATCIEEKSCSTTDYPSNHGNNAKIAILQLLLIGHFESVNSEKHLANH